MNLSELLEQYGWDNPVSYTAHIVFQGGQINSDCLEKLGGFNPSANYPVDVKEICYLVNDIYQADRGNPLPVIKNRTSKGFFGLDVDDSSGQILSQNQWQISASAVFTKQTISASAQVSPLDISLAISCMGGDLRNNGAFILECAPDTPLEFAPGWTITISDVKIGDTDISNAPAAPRVEAPMAENGPSAEPSTVSDVLAQIAGDYVPTAISITLPGKWTFPDSVNSNLLSAKGNLYHLTEPKAQMMGTILAAVGLDPGQAQNWADECEKPSLPGYFELWASSSSGQIEALIIEYIGGGEATLNLLFNKDGLSGLGTLSVTYDDGAYAFDLESGDAKITCRIFIGSEE